MKAFYIKDFSCWSKLCCGIDEECGETYEIRIPDGYVSNMEDGQCKNIIRLWDEKQYGDKYKYSLVMGESHYISSLAILDIEKYLYKIDEAVGDEKDIVLAVREDGLSEQLIDYFINLKRQKDFKLHIMVNVSIDVEEYGDRVLLPILNDLKEIETVAFFNHYRIREVDNEHNLSSKELLEEMLACEEIFGEEAGGLITQLLKLSAVNEEEIWLYDWAKREYELIKLRPEDMEDKADAMRKLYPQLPYEIIEPNEGKRTCQMLKKLRTDFKAEHGLKIREMSCRFSGECKGSCAYCENHAKRLWRDAYGENNKIVYTQTADIVGIIRLRQDIDGPGIRTLVVMNDCHMNCKQCINRDSINQKKRKKKMWAYALNDMIEKDNVYFEMTGGGVTFGGGEPLLNPGFIKDFKMNNPRISVAVETSLNVPYENVADLADVVDYWIVDVKDMNDDIYYSYTGHTNTFLIKNLKYLVNNIETNKIKCRVPQIKGYNTKTDVDKSVEALKALGVTDIECFEYMG